MVRFNPKAVYFWGAAFGVATCIAAHSTSGVAAFGVLTILTYIFA